MTEKELAASNRSYDVAAAIGIGFGSILLCTLFYVVLGISTRVIGICSGASASWAAIYDRLFFAIPIPGILAGWFANKYFSNKRKKKALLNTSRLAPSAPSTHAERDDSSGGRERITP